MSFIKCQKCGAINGEFNHKCHACDKMLDTGDGVIVTDNTGATGALTPKGE